MLIFVGIFRVPDATTKASIVVNKKSILDDLVKRRLYINPNDDQLNPTDEENELARIKEEK